jgi:hypothetical protein
MEEIWKDVVGYEGVYKVSNLGIVKRVAGVQAKNERILTQLNNGNGYMGVCLCINSKPIRMYVHRILATAFLTNTDNKPQVNHKDGDRSNNVLSNIEWVTSSENHHHKYQVLKRDGTNKGKFGKLNWNSKKVGMYLNESLIREFSGAMEASRELKCSDSTIRKVIYGKRSCFNGYTFKYELTQGRIRQGGNN